MTKFNPDKSNKNTPRGTQNSPNNNNKTNKPIKTDKPSLNKPQFRFKLPKTRKGKVISVCAIVLLALGGAVTYKVAHKDPVQEAFKTQVSKSGNGFQISDTETFTPKETDQKASKDTFTNGTEPYFKDNQVYIPTYIPTSKDGKEGTLSYVDPKTSSLTSLNVSDQGVPVSNGTQIKQTELYGFGAFKNEKTNTWIRIPFIQPIPEVEKLYDTYGGTSPDKVKTEIEMRQKRSEATLTKAENDNTVQKLDLSEVQELRSKGQTGKALDKASEQIISNASKLATPLTYYVQDSFNLPLEAKDLNSVKDTQYMNILNQTYYGLVSVEAVNKLNSVSQKTATSMLSDWGLKVKHSIYILEDKSYIIIDGISYKYSNVILDLYDNPNADSNGRTNILDTQNTKPNSNNYKVSIQAK